MFLFCKEAKSLPNREIFEHCAKKYDVNFDLGFVKDLKLQEQDMDQFQDLDDFLLFLEKKYNLTIEIKDNIVCIYEAQLIMKLYELNECEEESLKEIEKNIKFISNNYSLDYQNKILMVAEKEFQHKLVKEYLDKIKNNSHKQFLIEIKIVEVITNIQQNLGLSPIINDLNTETGLTSCVRSFVDQCKQIYTQARIQSSTDMQILIQSGKKGELNSTMNHFYEENTTELIKKIGISISKDNYKMQQYGLNITLSPKYLNDKICLLKLKSILSTPQKLGGESIKQPQNLQSRVLETDINIQYNKTYVLGGVHLDYEIKNQHKGSNFPLLKYLVNGKNNNKKRSYFIIFIKVSDA